MERAMGLAGRRLAGPSGLARLDGPLVPILPHFWLANLTGWLFISVLGFITRSVVFSDIASAAVRTVVFDTIGRQAGTAPLACSGGMC